MKEFMTSIESLLTRGYASVLLFLPSAVIAISIIYLLLEESTIVVQLSKLIVNPLTFISSFSALPALALMVFFALGVSMILNSLHKIAFDNLLRRNFGTLLCFINFPTRLDRLLENLRSLAINKLTKDKTILKIEEDEVKKSDYYLYESIGGIVHTDTREYVNDTRIIGYISLSLQAIFVLEFILRLYSPGIAVRDFFVLALIIVFEYIVGYEVIKYNYKLRAIRLYTNYLMDIDRAMPSLINDDTQEPA